MSDYAELLMRAKTCDTQTLEDMLLERGHIVALVADAKIVEHLTTHGGVRAPLLPLCSRLFRMLLTLR